MQLQPGLIAILDALGAARYSEAEINQFLKSRDLVLSLLQGKARGRVTVFTFSDTVLIVYPTDGPAIFADVRAFCELLRKFVINSLAQRILFRGAFAIGLFLVERGTQTVLGPAVTDAAAWYNRADWIGVTATPQATLLVQSLTEQRGDDLFRLVIDYPVPLKDRAPLSLKAVNWPKAFFVRGLRPWTDGERPRAKCLSLLAMNAVPQGTESKYFNTMAFFDYCESWRKRRKK